MLTYFLQLIECKWVTSNIQKKRFDAIFVIGFSKSSI